MTGTATAAFVGRAVRLVSMSLSGTGAMAVVGRAVRLVSMSQSGTANVAATASEKIAASAAFSGTGAQSATGSRVAMGVFSVPGSAQFNELATMLYGGTVAPIGTAAMTANGSMVYAASVFIQAASEVMAQARIASNNTPSNSITYRGKGASAKNRTKEPPWLVVKPEPKRKEPLIIANVPSHAAIVLPGMKVYSNGSHFPAIVEHKQAEPKVIWHRRTHAEAKAVTVAAMMMAGADVRARARVDKRDEALQILMGMEEVVEFR